MSLKGNQIKTNTIRTEQTASGFKEKNAKSNTTKIDFSSPIKFNNQRAVKIVGLFLLLLALYFLVAFISYLFSWQEDQSYVLSSNGGWSNLLKTYEELKINPAINPDIQNWAGKLGALISHQFIYQWFGIASFVFVAIFVIVGYRLLFKIKLYSIPKTLAYSFFILIFTSLTIAFFHGFINDYPHYLEGEFGFWANILLQGQIGGAGAASILVFALLSFLIIAYNIDFKLPERKKKESILYEDEEGAEEEMANEKLQQQHRGQSKFDSNELENIHQNHSLEKPLAESFASPLNANVIKPLETIDINEEKTLAIVNELEIEAPFEEKILLPDDEEVEEEIDFQVQKSDEERNSDDLVAQFGMFDPTLDLSSYKNPTLELLEQYGNAKISVDAAELESNKNKIVETLNNYNIEIDKIKATIGPTVTLYEIIPAPGVRISKIKNLEDDIALSLAALGIRIIAPMPGKGTIGIEVPNQHPEMVAMRSIIATEKFQNTNMDLPIALGKTISNEVFIADLAKMPHLLVAGATGQGKSVGINTILVSLLYKKHPSQLKFVLVDPKKVELTLFKKIERHFLAKLPGDDDAIITDTKKVINTLNSLCIEMDQRYDLLKDAGVRNLKEYNEKFVRRKLNPNNGHKYLPFIVLVIDEFADLMMTAGKEVEIPIARLAQLARAIGIHLILATQRPAVTIITGTIKANFPARLAFRVISKIDSRTILDSGGADQLIGKGDMLLSTGSDLIRLQCAFVDTPEVDRVTEYIGSQRGYASAYMLPEYVGDEGESSSKEFDASSRDALFEDAARLIVLHQQGSTSLIQRKMKLGYNRAGRIMDQLEGAGIVGPFEGSKAREVLISDEYSLEQFLDALNNKD